MFWLFDREEKRIVLINPDGLSVYVLKNSQLSLARQFSDEDVGHSEFREYLAEQPKSPVTLLVDSATEDFIVETVAHVGGMDRKAFLARKSDHHFRNVDYRSAQIIGRETEGRRDDRVLFSAITKNQVMDPWVKALLLEEIPIKAVTTPAYALCNVAKEYSMLTNDSVLLVNWEPSGIRQTFIVNGKTRFSRLTPLLQGDESELAAGIIESCSQSKEYLERIGLLAFAEKVDVHIITPHLADEDFEYFTDKSNFREVKHHNSIEMMELDHFNGPRLSITATLLCVDWGMHKGELENVYAPPQVLRFYVLVQTRKLIATFCLAFLILTALVSAPLLLDGMERNARTDELERETSPVQALHTSLRAQFPETPIPSEAMELAVRTHDQIRSQVVSPFDTLASISTVVGKYPSIRLTAFNWALEPVDENQELTAALLDNQTTVNLELYGELIESISVQDSDSRLRQFINSLESIGGIKVDPIVLPVEPDPFSEVNTIISDDVVDVEFALFLEFDLKAWP